MLIYLIIAPWQSKLNTPIISKSSLVDSNYYISKFLEDMEKASTRIKFPTTDLRSLADAFEYNAENDIAPMGSREAWTKLYIDDNDPTQLILSPQMGDFTGLPPLHICVGTHEVHYDDCVGTTRKAREHGVELILSEWPGMVHGFPLLSPLFPESKKAMVEIRAFARTQLDQ